MRVLALVATGTGEVNPVFVDKLRRIFTAAARTRILTSADARTQFSTAKFDRFALSKWLADIERQNDLVICITDAELSEWSQTVLRSTDQLLIVAEGATQDINRVEEFALAIIPTTRRRLVRLHATRRGVADKTAAWLRTPNRALGGEVPIDQLDTDLGVKEVENILGRIAYGVYS